MATINENIRTGRHCAFCGLALSSETPAIERFGERFCSEAHAEEFASGVRTRRMETAARAEATSMSCAMSSSRPRNWSGGLKRAACWGAPLLLLLAIPLFWSGSATAATGGSILSALALLACPLGMYFMMRAMGNMNHTGQTPTKDDAQKPDAPRH